MYLPIMFHQFALIFFAFYATKKLKTYEGTKKQRFLYGAKIFFVIMTLPMAVDAYSVYLIYSNDKLVRFFPHYEKLDEKLRDEFQSCMLTLGPLSYVLCPRYYKKQKSLLIPTDENLSERLNQCRFDGVWSPYPREKKDICDDALAEVAKTGTKEMQEAVFDRIVNESKRADCRSKEIYFRQGIEKFKKVSQVSIKKYRYVQMAKHGCIRGALFNRELLFDREFMGFFDEQFSKLDFSGIGKDLEFNWKVSLLELRFGYALNIKQGNAYGGVPHDVAAFSYTIYHSRRLGKLDQYKKVIKKFLEIELPGKVSRFPFEKLEDTSWLEFRIKKGVLDPRFPRSLGYRTISE